MARIDDLKNRLFKPGERFEEREHEPELPRLEEEVPHSWGGHPGIDPAIYLAARRRRRRIMSGVLFGVLLVLLAGVGASFFLLQRSGAVSSKNVEISILAPASITGGDRVAYEVRFKNGNQVALESAELTFDFPAGALPLSGNPPRGKFRERRDIGTLAAGEARVERFEAYVFGKEGTKLDAAASLEYRPSNSSARFGNDASFTVSVTRSPIGITLEFPGEANVGQEIELKAHYVSSAETTFHNVSLDLSYPGGFEFIASDPAPERSNNFWQLGDIASNQTGTITVRGKIMGNAEEAKVVSARIGLFTEETSQWSVYGEATRTVVLRPSLLAVEAVANGKKGYVAKAGETVVVTLNWRNNLPVTVTDVIVSATLSGAAVDYSHISADAGTVDGVNRRIIWNASSNPELKAVGPGSSGKMAFSARILSPLPILGSGDKNFVVTAKAEILSNLIPQGYEGVDISGKASVSVKVATAFDIASQGRYYTNLLPNTGPLPPKVGAETTYTITWALSNSANDLNNVEVRAAIPSFAHWKNAFDPGSEKLSYNADTGEIVWAVGALGAGTGVIHPAREVSFRVGLIPGPDLAGSSAELVFATTATASDTFTGQAMQSSASRVTTAVRSDSRVRLDQYNVAP